MGARKVVASLVIATLCGATDGPAFAAPSQQFTEADRAQVKDVLLRQAAAASAHDIAAFEQVLVPVEWAMETVGLRGRDRHGLILWSDGTSLSWPCTYVVSHWVQCGRSPRRGLDELPRKPAKSRKLREIPFRRLVSKLDTMPVL